MKGSLIAFNRYTRRGACGHARVHGHHDHDVALRRINWRGLPLRHLRPHVFSSSFSSSFFFFLRKAFAVHCATLHARQRGEGVRGEFFLRADFCGKEGWKLCRKMSKVRENSCVASFVLRSTKSMKRGIEMVYFMKTWPRRGEAQWRNL